ncbi:MAG: hypothetical protein ONB52_21875 [candidate division KSB1 bacterium]|nr:hypothetical protein [candidate division KSB1 bacterium]
MRLIDLPEPLWRPSEELLKRLRSIDPLVEVVYVGQGRYWLGRVKSDSARRLTGVRMLTRLNDGDGLEVTWPELRQAILMSQGFGLLAEVTCQGQPDALLERELRRLTYRSASDDQNRDPDEEARRARVQEIRQYERDLARWLFRRGSVYGRQDKFVTVNGLKGGLHVRT